MSIRFYTFILVLLFSLGPLQAGLQPTCRQLISTMLQEVENVHTASYTLNSSERVKGKILRATSHIKLNLHPRQLYFKNNAGVEIIYNELVDKENALVYPNTFPYFNLKLDPHRSIIRNNLHHTIFELGFHHVGSIIQNAVKYKVHKKETATSIALKLGVGEYRIIQNNANISFTDYIKEGRILSVPNVYASKTLMYIDKELNLPVYIKAFDDQGFYESYEFFDLKVNINFAPTEFEKSFPGYKF